VSLKARALRWLAQREHSRAELRRKLLRVLPDDDEPASVEATLDWLVERGYLDEARFAASRVRLREVRFGNRRIESELKAAGVALDDTTAAQLRASEQLRAQTVRNKRFGALPADAGERARQARFLAGRGFSADVIRRVLRPSGD
jgi:regulatory protein